MLESYKHNSMKVLLKLNQISLLKAAFPVTNTSQSTKLLGCLTSHTSPLISALTENYGSVRLVAPISFDSLYPLYLFILKFANT